MPLIEFHEDEMLNTFVEGTSTLGVLLSFLDIIGREAYDNLLYVGDKYARLHSPCARNVREVRSDLDSCDYVFDIFNQDNREEPPDPAEVAQVPALVDSG